MTGRITIGLFILLGAARPAGAADLDSLGRRSGNELRTAILYGPGQVPGIAKASDRRSIPLAFGMSAVVPGLGQAYNRDWIKAAAALAIEGGLTAAYLLWRAKGRDEEDAYKAYAHAYWSPAQYATWLNDYVVFLEEDYGAVINAGAIDVPSGIDFSEPESWTTAQRTVVRALFDQIHAAESEVFHPETGASFSHKLPYFAQQQYYELIGKYFQFAPGWADYPDWKVGGEFTGAIDPELTGPGGTKPNVQGRFLEYASNHAHANTLLRRASRVSGIILLNHIVAAFDAAISSKLHNDRLTTEVSLAYDRLNEPQVRTSIFWRF